MTDVCVIKTRQALRLRTVQVCVCVAEFNADKLALVIVQQLPRSDTKGYTSFAWGNKKKRKKNKRLNILLVGGRVITC